MGFRYRKSFKLAPGVRMTVSKSGIGYSVGGKGVRVTKRADGRVQKTVSLPGTGMSYTTITGSSARKRQVQRHVQPTPSVVLKASRRAKMAVPMSRRMKIERALVLIGMLATVVGLVVVPLLLLAVPCLFVGLVMMLANLRSELRWAREYQAARAQALIDLRG